jgi:hypothetical protein
MDDDPSSWFKLVDADNSGQLSKQELHEVFAATLDVDLGCLDELIKARWEEWDPDRTGSIGLAALKKHRLAAFIRRALPGRPPAAEASAPPLSSDAGGWFDHWDAGLCGKLSKDEVARGLIKNFGSNGELDVIRQTLEAVWQVFVVPESAEDAAAAAAAAQLFGGHGETGGWITRETFVQAEGLGDTLAASLRKFEPPVSHSTPRAAAGQTAGQRCGGCGKVHALVGDRVIRRDGAADGQPGTIRVDKEDEDGTAGVVWDFGSGEPEWFAWAADGPPELTFVQPTYQSPAALAVAETAALSVPLAAALLRRTNGDARTALDAFFSGRADPDTLAAEVPPLQMHHRARVLPDAEEVERLVVAHAKLEWSATRAQQVGREGWVLELDAADGTVRLDHAGTKCWYPTAAVFGVDDRTARPPPRFAIGAAVDCHMGSGTWQRGVVTEHWVRGSPYRIQVDGGAITAPSDRDTVIKLAPAEPEPASDPFS